ncbi:hypothetical protein SteCoe_32371 [Stentor coeruleus]|uniref:Uncharacterized protein n=1 Tax=Stentor coeruleus TaxID=5963 RepID=A0A1R2AZ59_9CILI|nr:hypothetical protein SteCoe_32371 [Stentor coeruleus]
MESAPESNLKEFLKQNNLINSEDDLINLATALIEKAYKKQLKDKTLSALAYLKQTEEILEILSSQGKPTKLEIIQVTLNNIAACYQRLGDMEKCAGYLEACSFNCYRNPVHTTIDSIALDIKQLKFHASLLIQLAVVLSNLKQHKEALEKATHAQNLTHLALRTTIEGHKVLIGYYKKNKQNKSLKQQIFQTIAESATKTLTALSDYLSTSIIPKTEEMRSVLGVKIFSNWVYEFSISNIIVIQPLTISEITEKPLLQAEFTKDYLLFKIALHCASMFCVATETKHLRTSQPLSVAQRKQSEIIHQTSISLLSAFFPQESPLVQHIVQSFQRRFVSELQEIPEEEPSAARSKSSDFSKFPHLKDKKHQKTKQKVSPYKRQFVSPRPKTSLEIRTQGSSKKNKGRGCSLDLQTRSRTPVENY